MAENLHTEQAQKQPPALSLSGLSKSFGPAAAVRDLSLDVRRREFVVLLGPSGCGKTTVLRMIAGLETVGAGRIAIDGRDVTRLPPRRRNVSMVFQNYAVWPHMTVRENIAFPLELRGVPAAEIDATVREVCRMTRIEEQLEKRPRQMSGGQQQRVALARALAVKPALFLMDEPFSNLDAILRVEMRTELKAIHHQAGATTVFVTHDQSEAMSMADRIVIMRAGCVEQVGTPDEVYRHCANEFVAGFIGSPPMNLFSVRVEGQGGDAVLRHEAFAVRAERIAPALPAACQDFAVRLGVRPEDIQLASPDDAALTAEVAVVEPQGAHQVVALRLGGELVKMLAPPDQTIRPGERLAIRFRPDRLHLFDAATGLRIES